MAKAKHRVSAKGVGIMTRPLASWRASTDTKKGHPMNPRIIIPLALSLLALGGCHGERVTDESGESTPFRRVTLDDGTRCVSYWNAYGAGISCDFPPAPARPEVGS